MSFEDAQMILQVITPEKVLIEVPDVEIVVFRTIGVEDPGGEIGVLRNHAPMLARIPTSAVRYKKDKKTYYLAVAGGFVEVRDNRVTILSTGAEKVERREELALALEARSRTEAWLQGKIGKVEFDEKMAEVELKRETIRMYKEEHGE